jgi:hypothetical protein
MKLIPITALILLVCLICQAQDAAKQISAITDEVEKQLATLKVSTDLTQQCTNDIAETRANLKQGNYYLSLYTIRTCWLELGSQSYAASKAEVQKKGMDAFEEEWRQLGLALTEKENRLSGPAGKRVTGVALGLAQVSQIQARPYYQSGRLFALNSSLAEGLYYLGRAPANLDFAIYARGLNFSEGKSLLTLRSVEPELTKFETAVIRTYKSADVRNQQAQYNRLNSNLKVAGELNRASMFEGALIKYLESKLYFGLIVTTAEKVDLQHLQERSKEVGKQLKSGKSDQSIALLFWQMSEMALNPAKSLPTEAQIKRAAVILDSVLPSYFDYMKENK